MTIPGVFARKRGGTFEDIQIDGLDSIRLVDAERNRNLGPALRSCALRPTH